MVVYILFSDISSKYYVGRTADIVDRMKRHNQGRIISTRNGVPWKLIKQVSVEDRSKALKLEKKIKKRGAKRFLEDLEKKSL